MSIQPTQKWQTTEGDIMLCKNLPEWCPTISPTIAWRHESRIGTYRRRLRESKSRTGRVFHLRYGDQSQYLTVSRSEWIPHMTKTKLGFKPGLDFKPDSIAMISLFVSDCVKFGCCFDFRTPEGVPVSKVEYGKLYALRNPATGLYVSCTTSVVPLLAKKHPESYVYLQNEAQNATGEVKQCDTVILGLTARFGDQFSIHLSKWHGADGMLFGISDYSRKGISHSEPRPPLLQFTFMYQDQEKT